MASYVTSQRHPSPSESHDVDSEAEALTTGGRTERSQRNLQQRQEARQKQTNARPGKVIISKSRWWLGILVHVVPILAVTAILILNFRGYFVGTQFVGVTNSTSQSIALSALQVTAKLSEIAVIASLGYLILDIVQYFLLFDEAGLPLALTGIRTSFSNLFFLASPTFWSGMRAFRSTRTRIIIAFLLLSCGLIATFVGPAAALLLIPAIRTDWLAGSFLYQAPSISGTPGKWMVWDSQLNNSSVIMATMMECSNPSEENLTVSSVSFQSCLWSGADSLEFFITSSTMFLPSGNLTVQGQESSRYVSWFSYNENNVYPTLWAWSSMNAANFIANTLFERWHSDADYNSQSIPIQYSRYVYKDRLGSQTRLQGLLAPLTRAACLESIRDFQALKSDSFPVVPLSGVAFLDTNATYTISTDLLKNTSVPRAFWISKPATVQGVNLTTEYIQHLPSAFLVAQIPIENSTHGMVLTCSVDARWANATQFSVSYDENFFEIDDYVTSPEIYSSVDEDTFDGDGRPSTSKLLPRIDLDSSWLELLTPTIQQTELGTNSTQLFHGYNFLSRMLGSPSFNNLVYDPYGEYIQYFQLLLSLLVVDGMTRNNPVDSSIIWDMMNSSTVLANGGQPAKLQQDPSKLERSEFLWTMTISGYAYAIDSTAYILAATVLFSYILFALCHICFIIYKKWHAEIWWAIPDITALAHHSPPSMLLKNIAGGTDLRDLDKLLVKLRVPDDAEENEETVHLLVDSHGRNPDRIKEVAGYYKLEKGKKYC